MSRRVGFSNSRCPWKHTQTSSFPFILDIIADRSFAKTANWGNYSSLGVKMQKCIISHSHYPQSFAQVITIRAEVATQGKASLPFFIFGLGQRTRKCRLRSQCGLATQDVSWAPDRAFHFHFPSGLRAAAKLQAKTIHTLSIRLPCLFEWGLTDRAESTRVKPVKGVMGLVSFQSFYVTNKAWWQILLSQLLSSHEKRWACYCYTFTLFQWCRGRKRNLCHPAHCPHPWLSSV